jgi:predicted nucleic acid-binding Zn ribbon protein
VKPRSGKLESVGRLVPRVLEELGFDAAVRVVRIADRWEEAVGPEIARHCRPSSLDGATLEATVDSSVWCQELRLRSPEILAALRRVLGDDAPSQLRLRLADRC